MNLTVDNPLVFFHGCLEMGSGLRPAQPKECECSGWQDRVNVAMTFQSQRDGNPWSEEASGGGDGALPVAVPLAMYALVLHTPPTCLWNE